MRLSLIICVYNTSHELISDCLRSIYAEHGCEDFEVIFVDDGSTLDYSDLLEKHPVKYSKIENRGHLGARLYGISIATGEYIGFVDSDDSVSLNYHAPMLECAEESGADIVINGWAFHTDRTKRICLKDTTMNRSIDVSGDECLAMYAAQRGTEHSYYVLWNKIYRRELLVRSASELSESLGEGSRMTYGEDVLLNFFCFKNAKRIKNVNSGLYFYRIHSSQSVIAATEEKLASQIKCMSIAFKIMLSGIGENALGKKIEGDVHEWRDLISRAHYATARAQKYEELYPLIRESYTVDKLRLPRLSDGAFYTSSELLGDNFRDIDSALTELYYREKPTEALYEKRSAYVTRAVDFIRSTSGDVVYSRTPSCIVPKRKIKLRDRIIHNPLIYRLGLIFFKKGSRIRNFLKKHL